MKKMKTLMVFLWYGLIPPLIFSQSIRYESDHLVIQEIKPGVYIHISYLYAEGYGKVACNGIIYIQNREAVVADTPVDSLAAEELLTWLEEQRVKTIAVVPTHFHTDCLGSLSVFHQHGIPSFANKETITRTDSMTQPKAQNAFSESLSLLVGGARIFFHFVGAGHTSDNIVVWIPEYQVLFGGCLIKAVGAGEGNLLDADRLAWSQTVAKIETKYPYEDLLVVPGHGQWGGRELLNFTKKLFQVDPDRSYVFYIHNRWLEGRRLDALHPQYGPVEYEAILNAFNKAGLIVISEKRREEVLVDNYAEKIVQSINYLLAQGVPPGRITVIGASKGGYIAQTVSTILKNPLLNYVFIGSSPPAGSMTPPGTQYFGNILSIYEISDTVTGSASEIAEYSGLTVTSFKEVKLNTGLQHGFLFKAIDGWMRPAIHWAKQEFDSIKVE